MIMIPIIFWQGYRDKISDVREEIMRKRRAGKLPGDTTAVLKAWWNAHSKWPYPTVVSSPDWDFLRGENYLIDTSLFCFRKRRRRC